MYPKPRRFSRHFAERRRWLPAFNLITPHVLLTRAPFEKSLESGMGVTNMGYFCWVCVSSPGVRVMLMRSALEHPSGVLLLNVIVHSGLWIRTAVLE